MPSCAVDVLYVLALYKSTFLLAYLILTVFAFTELAYLALTWRCSNSLY